jgi:hypothetical protein
MTPYRFFSRPTSRALGNWRLAYTQVARSREFDGQEEHQDYGSVTIQYVLDF